MEINDNNVALLQFLECLKNLDKCAEEDFEVCGKILTKFAKDNHITKTQIDQVIELYPLKVYKAIYDTGVEYVSA